MAFAEWDFPGWRKETYANDGLGADQLDQAVLETALGVTLSISLEVAQVTNVAGLVGAVAVGLVVGVDCAAGGDGN